MASMRADSGSFHVIGIAMRPARQLRIKCIRSNFYLTNGRQTQISLYHAKGIISAGTGSFTFTGVSTSLKVMRKVSPVPGKFTFLGGYASIFKANQPGYLIDDFAEDAIPVPSFFVPVMRWSQPDAALTLDQAFGASSGHVYSTIFNDYYNQDTNTWNDDGYGEDNPGQTIPVSLKAQVADQLYNYNVYVALNAEWQAEYERETIFQWPYYYASQVIARKTLV